MRSSVSYILSSATSEPNMSHPDYEQNSIDHAALLVLVRPIGTQLKTKTFTRLFERICRIDNIKITDSAGCVRNILVRYIKEHPVENNDWGDFQTHRRLLGIISIGKYDTQQELNEICRVHESLKVKYINTLFDTRCIIFGPSEIGPEIDETLSESKKYTTPSNFKTRALFYSDNDPCIDLETNLHEYLNSLFWVLESKRLDRSREKIDKVSLVLAPFEKKDFVGLDMESRNNKKRCMGRITKHLADLSLQAGLISESLSLYYSASDTLKSVNDWLWLGAAYEGLCAASVLVLYPNLQRNIKLQRNSSLQDGSPGKNRSNSVVSLKIENVRKQITNVLPEDEICKKYREAIIHYSKYQNAGIIETEASFKAAKISIEQNHILQAASFLQNVVFINLTLNELEKIQRFETLSELYTQIGFTRKASFCQRLAATRYVSQNNPQPNWTECYNLMLQSFVGHKLCLDPNDVLEEQRGWPSLQVQLLQEIVVAARRMGHSALATRHMTFLLQTMWSHLSSAEQRDFCIQLQSLSAQCEGSPVPLVLESGVVIPPANLTNIPLCKMFKLQNLKPQLQPQKIEQVKPDIGPFLFTPIQFGSMDRKSNKVKSKMDYVWVENDTCEVSLKLVNILPFELTVSNMRLLTSGPVFESIPETVTLAPNTPETVTLKGTPKEIGELDILGYSTHVLGIKSNCRLRNMKKFLPHYNIEIIPVLPIIQTKTSVLGSNSESDNINMSLYHGESTECTITLTNISDVPIELLEISLHSVLDPTLQNQIFTYSQSDIQSQLPLLPQATASFTLYVYSSTNFLGPLFYQGQGELSSGIFSSRASSIMSVGVDHNSLPSRINSPVTRSGFSGRRNDFTSSFRSSNSGQSSLTTIGGGRSPAPVGLPYIPAQTASTMIDAHLKIKYSGGAGFNAGYCRTSCVYISLEMLPSVQITNWDVLPAETPLQFYLVLDIANLTSQEMELYYTPTKNILIEGHESCRVPVPLDRCPLSKLSKLYLKETAPIEEYSDLDKICSEHVSNSVDLQWSLLGTSRKGKASLKGILLDSDMLDLVRMSPLHWDIKINSLLVKPQDNVSYSIGESVCLSVSIKNTLDRPLQQLILSLQFYQDHLNGINNYRLETRLALSGATKIYIPVLNLEEVAYHECMVIFFTPGVYKVNVQCSTNENIYGTMKKANTEEPHSNHTWKYLPAVEINIVE